MLQSVGEPLAFLDRREAIHALAQARLDIVIHAIRQRLGSVTLDRPYSVTNPSFDGLLLQRVGVS